jgi:hypothetical protein
MEDKLEVPYPYYSRPNPDGVLVSVAEDWVNLFHNPSANKPWLSREHAEDIVALAQRIATAGNGDGK